MTIPKIEEATKRRLQSLPALKEKCADDKARLEKIRRAKSGAAAVRLAPNGYKLPPEDAAKLARKEAAALGSARDLERGIARDEKEIATLERALDRIRKDSFYPAVSGKYFDRYDDKDIAKDLGCSLTAMRKGRKLLMRDVAVELYGMRGSRAF
jgi:hypothetical protein